MNHDTTNITWEIARDLNRKNWDDRVDIHEKSYNLELLQNPAYQTDVIRDDLATLVPFLPSRTVEDLDICHLQCHIGTDTLSLVRAGARVTAVDFSPVALRSAAHLADAFGLSVTWVESDVMEARANVSGDFDIVYTSIGIVNWLSNLDGWAEQVAGLLKPSGTFFIRDGHPMLYSLDENADELVLRYPYFGDCQPLQWDTETSYVGNGIIAHKRTYQWPHSLSEILNALLKARLRLVHVEEGRTLPWKFSKRMIEVPGGFAWAAAERNLVPCTYTIIARRN